MMSRKTKPASERNLAVCSVDDCSMSANRVGAGMCEKHYMRMRRNGQTAKLDMVKPGLLTHSHGYKLAHEPNHSLRRSSSRVYEHRVVYHAHHGDGPFPCHWCSAVVTWDDMHVDHLNDIKDDNSPDNLVASCPTCNQARGVEKMRIAMRMNSKRRHTVHGKTMCLSEWSRELGISNASINSRLKRGWSLEDAFSPRRTNAGPASKCRA